LLGCANGPRRGEMTGQKMRRETEEYRKQTSKPSPQNDEGKREGTHGTGHAGYITALPMHAYLTGTGRF
jgi:hypothetical protein